MSVPQTLGGSTTMSASPLRLASRRFLLWGAPALILGAASASAQQVVDIQKAPVDTKYGGIYHTQTGTWTRRVNQFGPSMPDIIFSNTASSTYFSTAGGAGGFAPGSENYDEGGLPGTANGHPFAIGPDRDTYRVNGYQINYCDFGAPLSGGWEISFYESYVPCTSNGAPLTSITSTGLPANGCWTIDIDLTGAQEFDIAADGGDGWQDDPDLDSFGWSFRYAGSDPNGGGAGFFLAGDPGSTDPSWVPGGIPIDGLGTYYGGPSLCSGNTGYLLQDLWFLEDSTSTTNTGCYFFGGYANGTGCDQSFNPHASWSMEIYADAGEQPEIGTDYCQSTMNSTGAMTTLTASGSEVATDDAVELSASNLPADSLAFFITSQTQGFAMNPGGSAGNLCLVGDVGRFMQPGQVKVSGADGTFTLSTTLGEWSTSAIPQATPPLFYAAMTGITSNFQLWHRDAVMGSATSNFSNGLSITWL